MLKNNYRPNLPDKSRTRGYEMVRLPGIRAALIAFDLTGMTKSRLFFLVALLICFSSKAQEIWFFSEGTTSSFYDQGIVDKGNLGSSTFETAYPPGLPQYNDKVPCSTNGWKGSTSLKFNFTSSESGNWKVTIYRNDWSVADLTNTDSLSFYILSAFDMPSSALPLIGLRTVQKSGTGDANSKLYPLAAFNGSVPSGEWTRITFPLSAISGDPGNSQTDLSRVKGVLFNQSEKNNSSRLLLVDEIMAFKSLEVIPPVTGLTAAGYDSHVELSWSKPLDKLSSRIYASFDGGQVFEVRGETTGSHYLDFLPASARNKAIAYKVVSVLQERESLPMETIATVRDYSDDELLDMMQRYTFRYFWEGAHQASGMALERSNGSGTTAASGATGMGLMAMIAAHEREYKPREQIKERIVKILEFLQRCDRHHGAWSHWYNGDTGSTQPFSTYDDGGDLVETSFVAQALVALKNYFTGDDPLSVQIREKADLLWKGIDWDWYRQGGQNVLFWHWSPNHGFRMNMKITGWNECLVTYVMAASSPTHPVPPAVYTAGWARNGALVKKRTYYNREISLSPDWGGPLFWIHYSHLGINPHGLKDQYADYWTEHVNTALIHYDYAVDNPRGWKNFGTNCWGLTASDDPSGYTAHQPVLNDNGTISPTAALASMPYAPMEAMNALKYFYRVRGKDIFGLYGPYDAFNDDLGWVKKAWLGIDQGPIMVMIENYRSGLLWNTVMKDTDVQAGLTKLGFTFIVATAEASGGHDSILSIYPNPAADKATLILPGFSDRCELELFSTNGQIVLKKTIPPDVTHETIDCSKLSLGLFFVRVKTGNHVFQNKLIIER